jgi:UDP-2-acetamido-3-amino-2,3-dideoxy-glucuronate N-acetyltransferase
MIVGKNTRIWHEEKSVFLDCVIGDDCTIHAPVWIGNNVVIGDRCKIQAFTFIPEGVRIGNDVFIGPHVVFTNDLNPPSPIVDKTLVQNGASIGANTTVVCGTIIGRNARIGAGSVITKDIPDDTLAYGVPARVIRNKEPKSRCA